MLKKASASVFQPELASEAQFNVLVLLQDAQKPLTQKELSRKLLVDKSNMTGLIERLEQQGLVARTQSEYDRRSADVSLTKAGQKLTAKVDKRYAERVQSIMADLSERDCKDLIRLLKKIRKNIHSLEKVDSSTI